MSYVAEDKSWVRKNVFYTKCTSHGKVCLVIIDSGSFENVVSLEIVRKLKLDNLSSTSSPIMLAAKGE